MIAPFVYVLCLVASAACALLLVRQYHNHRTPLLLWSAACFVLLALNNFLVVIDIILFPTIDFGLYRTVTALGAVGTLLYGFIWGLIDVPMTIFLSGMTTMGFVSVGLFFFRFWWRTKDGSFLSCSVAFWLFALSQGLVTLLQPGREEHGLFYLLRLGGFAVIITAIIFENRCP
jgi:hypothetical protein